MTSRTAVVASCILLLGACVFASTPEPVTGFYRYSRGEIHGFLEEAISRSASGRRDGVQTVQDSTCIYSRGQQRSLAPRGR
jgi:hypothetical protein